MKGGSASKPEQRRLRSTWVAAAVFFASAAFAGEAKLGPDALKDLGWMVGSFGGEQNGVEMEEHWTAPKGGMMLGLHRDVRPGERAFFEYPRIEGDEGGRARSKEWCWRPS